MLGCYIFARQEEKQQQQRKEDMLVEGEARLVEGEIRRRRRNPRSMWVRQWSQLGHYTTLVNKELKHEDINAFTTYNQDARDLFN